MRNLPLLLLMLFSLSIQAKDSGKFTVKMQEEYIDAPVSISLSGLGVSLDLDSILLYEWTDGEERRVPFQLESSASSTLWFVLDGVSKKNSERKFFVKSGTNAKENEKSEFYLSKTNDNLIIHHGERTVLKYRHSTMFSPEGVNPLFKRSGFIHPLNSPKGEELTRVQAPDHYHHYGIWGPWTLTKIDGREVDFWNLAKGEGTVKFESFLSEISGDVYTGFKVLQQHIDFGNKGEDQVALNEVLEVRVWNVSPEVWVVDYISTLNSPLPNGILLDAYRYGGGIGFRATEKWVKDNSTVLTSEGKTRVDADGSHARWCIVEGEASVPEKRSGILFMSHPFNRQHPEPMRVWPMDANGGRGDLYFEFVPIRHVPWTIHPHQDYTLYYRMIVFDGEMDSDTAETYWNSFATAPRIEIDR
ncbi:MAG: PmoA family protein [Proteiniphilum sp.]